MASRGPETLQTSRPGGTEPSGVVAANNGVLPPGARTVKLSFAQRLRRMPLSVRVCLVIILILAVAAVFAPWVAPHDPNETSLMYRNRPPTFWKDGKLGHVLGTDQLGRDTLSRCIYSLRTSVGIALIGLFLGGLAGITLGVLGGLLGGWVDRIVTSLIDFQMAVPYMLIILVGITLLGYDIPVLIALIGFARWQNYARITRGQVLAIRQHPFVEAAQALGASTWRISIRHIIPNILSPLLVLLTMSFPRVLMLESSLSFLGIGIQPPTASLGRMVGEGRDYMMSHLWVVLSPAVLIVLITLCMQIVGDWLRDVADVRLEK